MAVVLRGGQETLLREPEGHFILRCHCRRCWLLLSLVVIIVVVVVVLTTLLSNENERRVRRHRRCVTPHGFFHECGHVRRWPTGSVSGGQRPMEDDRELREPPHARPRHVDGVLLDVVVGVGGDDVHDVVHRAALRLVRRDRVMGVERDLSTTHVKVLLVAALDLERLGRFARSNDDDAVGQACDDRAMLVRRGVVGGVEAHKDGGR